MRVHDCYRFRSDHYEAFKTNAFLPLKSLFIRIAGGFSMQEAPITCWVDVPITALLFTAPLYKLLHILCQLKEYFGGELYP
ncbi:hypothetical protein SAMD00079811_14720 [Scytonema sp. HK-05]|nr:hypothetical protein SAMD00079811_14720 [Scytonema sp. HK-05]